VEADLGELSGWSAIVVAEMVEVSRCQAVVAVVDRVHIDAVRVVDGAAIESIANDVPGRGYWSDQKTDDFLVGHHPPRVTTAVLQDEVIGRDVAGALLAVHRDSVTIPVEDVALDRYVRAVRGFDTIAR